MHKQFSVFLTIAVLFYIAVFIFISNTNIYNITPSVNNDRFFSMDDVYYAVNIYNPDTDMSTRIVKHPLLIPAASVFAKAERALFGEISLYNHYRIIVIFQMLCFFISLIYLYKILSEQFKLYGIYLFSLLTLYTFSASVLIFTFIIESYIISSMLLIMAYYYIIKDNAPVSVILGVCLAGVTITNAVFWTLMLILSETGVKIIRIISAAVLFCLIVFITPGGKLFYDNLISVFISSPGNYRDHFGIFEAVKYIFFTIFGSTMFCIDITGQSPFGEFTGSSVSFIPSANFTVVLTICLWILFLLYAVVKNYRDRKVLTALSVLIFNIFLHGILQYGLKEGFLYSLHHFFAQILITAPMLAYKKKKIAAAVILYTAFMLCINFYGFNEIFKIAKQF